MVVLHCMCVIACHCSFVTVPGYFYASLWPCFVLLWRLTFRYDRYVLVFLLCGFSCLYLTGFAFVVAFLLIVCQLLVIFHCSVAMFCVIVSV